MFSILDSASAEKVTTYMVQQQIAICNVEGFPAKSVAAIIQTAYIVVSEKQTSKPA